MRPTWTDEAVFAVAHERLVELLPGDGPLAERNARYEESIRVPADRIEDAVAAAIDAARDSTRRLVDLPPGEGVELELVRDVPWLAFCEYLGELPQQDLRQRRPAAVGARAARRRDARDVSRPPRGALPKEQLLVRERGLLEETLVLVPTPQSLDLGGNREARAVRCCSRARRADARRGRARRRDRARSRARARRGPGRSSRVSGRAVNAALMVHDGGAGEEEVQAYLERWELMTPELAAHLIRFLAEPTSRDVHCHLPGRARALPRVRRREPERFRRLLTEQVRVGDLLAAGSAA